VLDELLTGEEKARPPRRTRRRVALRRLLLVAGIFVLLVALVAGGFTWFLTRKAEGNLHREAMLPGQGDSAVESSAPRGKGSNFLVIGSDARPGDGASRSDVIILAHVDRDNSRVDLIHFPRDLYVPIPGRGRDKINAAFAYGGAPLLVATLQDLVGARIDHVAKIDFEGFRRLTDAVGGVRVWAEEGSDGTGNGGPVVIEKGWNDLDGTEALAFVRERYELSEGDISRGRRQQAFLKALLLKTLQPEVLANPLRLNRIVDAATANTVLDEDFDTREIIAQIFKMRGVRGGDIHFVTAPFSGFGRSPQGASIVTLNDAGMRRLARAVRTDDLASYEE
jgi:LCP family protein required for cell wall assembly